MANTSRSSVASTKEGTDTNSVVRKMITRSGQRLRVSAATEPSVSPSTTASPAAMPPSLADTAKESRMVTEISRPVLREMPKSPCSRFFI